ncbi:MAG: glycoside hydrolase family 172 protein [Candidatus Hydrogenedentota bacterium]
MRMIATLALVLTAVSTSEGQPPLQGALDGLTLRQDYEAMRASSSNEDLTSNGDALSIPTGETLTLLDVDGPGVITHFWNTIAPLDPFAGRSVVLRIYYDGHEHPSVQAPLGDFFAVGHGAHKNVTSLPVTVSSHGLSRTCYWRMPFREHIKVTVSNDSPMFPVVSFYYYLNWQKRESLPEETMYFHAKYRQAMPAKPGHYTLLETEGRGHYAGTVYSVDQVELGWFGEGDDFIYIDGAEYPQLRGTGTEDYFNDAWGFREFCTPFHGVSLYEGLYPSDRVTAYRWHIQDPIPFDKSLRVTMEHRGSVMNEAAKDEDVSLGGSTERPDWISSVAFWYQYPPVSITDTLPPADKRVAPYRIIPVAELPYRADPPEKVTPGHVGRRYFTTGKKASIEFDFEVEKPGRYRIRGLFEDTIAGGIFQAYLDEKPIGLPIDMVLPDSNFIWHDLDLHDLEPGTHTLRFEKVDKKSPTERSIDFKFTRFTLEYLLLLRLEDMEGYHELYDERVEKK